MTYRLPLDIDDLRARVRDGQSFTYLPFYGHTAEKGRVTNAVYSQSIPSISASMANAIAGPSNG